MSHAHCQHHAPTNYNRVFAFGVLLNLVYIVVEVYFGLAGNSLALLADAGHNFSDVLGLLLAWAGHVVSQWPACRKRTFGYGSTSILAALINALLLLVAVAGISWEAVHRFQQPSPPAGITMMWVAGVGVAINTLTALLFLKGRHHDLNLRGAYLHMAADAAVSLGVVISGGLILLTNAAWLDPAISLIVAFVILIGTWGLLRESFNLIMQGVPVGIDLKQVDSFLQDFPEVSSVHDLHVWGMSTTENSLSAHLVCPNLENHDDILRKIRAGLHDRFDIRHSTLQIERDSDAANCLKTDRHEISFG